MNATVCDVSRCIYAAQMAFQGPYNLGPIIRNLDTIRQDSDNILCSSPKSYPGHSGKGVRAGTTVHRAAESIDLARRDCPTPLFHKSPRGFDGGGRRQGQHGGTRFNGKAHRDQGLVTSYEQKIMAESAGARVVV